MFDLPEGVTVRHHDPEWIQTLTSDFETVALDQINVVTMNGNPAKAFQWFGLKQAAPKLKNLDLPWAVMTLASIRNDFDEIARLSDRHVTGNDRYYSFLVSLVPAEAAKVLDIGCGLGELISRLAIANREVTGVDLSPE